VRDGTGDFGQDVRVRLDLAVEVAGHAREVVERAADVGDHRGQVGVHGGER